jgi:hypothetical protein
MLPLWEWGTHRIEEEQTKYQWQFHREDPCPTWRGRHVLGLELPEYLEVRPGDQPGPMGPTPVDIPTALGSTTT